MSLLAKAALAILLSLYAASRLTAQGLPQGIFVSIEESRFNAVPNDPSVDNGPAVNDALSTWGIDWHGTLYVPAKFYYHQTPITFPNMIGGRVLGAGRGVDWPPDNPVQTVAGKLVYNGPPRAAQITYPGHYGVLEGLHLQGNDNSIGIHVPAAQGRSNPGRLMLRDMTLRRHKTSILLGHPLDREPDGANNADHLVLDNVRFMHEFRAEPDTTCLHVRNTQAVDIVVQKAAVSGYPGQVFWFERGGRFVCNQVSVAGGHTTLLRLGLTDINNAHYKIQFDMDRGNTPFELLRMDVNNFAPTYVELSGSIEGGDYPTPIVTARGACQVVLRGISGAIGLKRESLLLLGQNKQGSQRWCHVHLENVLLETSDPHELIRPDSRAPYRLTWRNCWRRVVSRGSEWNQKDWLVPVEDGEESFSN